MAATAFLIGDDGLLLLAVEDVLVDGQRLEGIGVTPTIEVPFELALRGGRRPGADRAVQVLQGLELRALGRVAAVRIDENYAPGRNRAPLAKSPQ